MPFVRIIEARIRGTMHGQETFNVFHFGTNAAPGDMPALVALLIELAEAIIFCAINQLTPAVTSDWTLEEVDVKQLHPVLTDPVAVAAPAGTVGTRASTNVSFAAVLMRIKTGFGGKSKRGRRFLPPPGDADMTNSLLVAGPANDFYSGFIQCLTDRFVGPTATEQFRLGVLSRKHLKDVPNDFDGAFTEAATLAIEQRIKSCNSRKLGHGA